ncbi:MAG TPA: amylo-alpha-1,6-glucosidase [Candidatus Obscuribacterales bacterium]
MASPEGQRYVVDMRPLCQGMPFVLTDAAHPRLVLKHGSHFLVLDESANIPACNTLGYGYYRYDTRHISQWELYLNGDVPLSLLSSSVEPGYAGSFIYTNPASGDLPQQKITINREVVLTEQLWERLAIESFHNQDLDCTLVIKFQSDFADMFEVRGLNRPARGERMVPLAGSDGSRLFLAYRGLDGVLLETEIEFIGMKPHSINEGEVTFHLHLPVRQAVRFELCVKTRMDGQPLGTSDDSTGYHHARHAADLRYSEWRHHGSLITTEHELFDLAIKRGFRDIYIMRQPTPKGWGLAAGVPWYCAIFGRDSAITAWQLLPVMPGLARECIEVLAAYQGKRKDTFRAERPGKILHELRLGELARTHIIPHTPYYGTVDATPLWLILFAQYIHWSGDLDFARQLWPHVRAAIAFLDRTADGGFLTYQRESPQGLENQGWKDSGDSVMHTDGSLAHPPIAICEAQAYLYASRLKIAEIAELLGHGSLAGRLRAEAAQLRDLFAKHFWMEDENFPALALDGDGRPVRVISSNPGHCLWTGILDQDKADAVADRLLYRDMHSGWGIRTLSSQAVAFNPISYHNGSVWPHDNGIIAEGMVKIGRTHDAHKLLHGLFEVCEHQRDFRLPELFCGFERHEASRPIDYPVSCSPQAWAAGSIFQILTACMNLQPDACRQQLRIVNPLLPDWLGTVTIRGLRVGQASLDLCFSTRSGASFCQILRKEGNIKVIVEA